MLDSLFQNTLSGWQWGMMALVPPAIIALYFLKLKRVPLEIPSTYLWQRAIEDLHVNSFWQRLRRSLLLLLQLIIVVLAIMALLRPGWQGTTLEGERLIFLVDNSASMSSSDAARDVHRLAEAKRHVRALIGQMGSGMSAMIISFTDTPQVVQEFTDNRRLLRERLDTIAPTARGTDLKGALELASGLANPAPMIVEEEGMEFKITEQIDASVYIFTDGRFADVAGFSLGNLEPIFVPIGTANAENAAISALSTRRSELRPESQQAYVEVRSYMDRSQKVSLEMHLDDDFLDAREIQLAAGEAAGAVFPVPTGRVGAMRVKLSSPEIQDRLSLDDIGYAPVNDLRPGRVLLITPSNDWLLTALSTARALRLAKTDIAPPNILSQQEFRQHATATDYDLVIFDQCAPTAAEWMPRANTLFIGSMPPLSRWQTKDGEPAAGIQILVWNQQHPMMADIDLGNVQLVDSLILAAPPGATSLIESTQGPIAAIAPRDGFEDCVLGFEIVSVDQEGGVSINTNWPNRHSFPTFWLNTLEYFTAASGQSTVGSVAPAQPITLRLATAADSVEVLLPDGTTRTVRRDKHGVFQFQDTFFLGNYSVRDGDQVVDRFAVNLFDRQESDIRLVVSSAAGDEADAAEPSLKIGHVAVAGQRQATPERKELWKWLLLGALAVLLFEWYIYNRRVYI